MVDDYGRSLTKGFETTATTLADAKTYTEAGLTALHAISDAGWQKQDYLDAQTTTQAATAGANRDVGATLRVTLNNGKNYALKIPMPAAAIVNPDGSIDIADEDVLAYVALFETAGHLRVSEGNFVTALLSGSLDK
jgi:hypothetical protein